jgi:Domain of unknown function (DUF4124)
MRMRLFILISVLMAAGTVMAQAYRWVDEDGVVHYSDRPQEGAELVILPTHTQVTRRSQPAPAPRTQPAGDQQAAPTPFKYESISVASPAPEETLWNIAGVLNVSLDLQPSLQDGHQVRVFFDGNERMVRGTSFQIEEVYRGVHNLQAEIVDATGKLMIRSVPNRFYVQATSIN